MRTVGVEEELLLVDRVSGRALPAAHQVLDRAGTEGATQDAVGLLDKELQQQQVETHTAPHTELDRLGEDLRTGRRTAIAAAGRAGAQVAALATCPLPVVPRAMDTLRYRTMVERFGLTARENLTCGCHVHVSVASHEEAVGVLDRIRSWLPVLIALSANSPFWQGRDTSYASFRIQAQARWPSAGPTEIFGSAQAYDSRIAALLASETLLDAGMFYFDARASHHHPTVEIRVADVCQDVADAVVAAGLCRALVTTAAQEWGAGEAPAPIPVDLLRMADWQASRAGIGGRLLDPRTGRPRPAGQVVATLVEHVRPALRACGDEAVVEAGVELVLTRGNGADRQRAVLERTGRLAAVVADAVRVTAGEQT